MAYIGGLEVLSEPIKQELAKQMRSSENVQYCLAPRSTCPSITSRVLEIPWFIFFVEQNFNWLDGVVALDNRVIVFYGSEVLGNVTGFRTTSIEFLDIKSIEVLKSEPILVNVFLELNGNRIRMPGKSESEVRTFAEWLREKVRQARTTVETRQDISGTSNLTVELERLSSLHQSRVLSDAEFEAAKRRILGMQN